MWPEDAMEAYSTACRAMRAEGYVWSIEEGLYVRGDERVMVTGQGRRIPLESRPTSPPKTAR